MAGMLRPEPYGILVPAGGVVQEQSFGQCNLGVSNPSN